MTWRPPGTLRVLRVLAWTAVLRLVRAATIRRGKRKAAPGPRQATAQKGGNGLVLLMLLMLPLFGFQALVTSSQAVARLADAVQRPVVEVEDDEVQVSQWRPARHRRVEELLLLSAADWSAPEQRQHFVGCATALLLAVLTMLLAVAFGGANASLAGGGWAQAWLLTFPVPTRSLVIARALEYSLVQVFPWLVMLPLAWQFLRVLGADHALLLAALGTLSVTVLVGSLRLWLETWLRQRFSLGTLRNLQATATLFSLGLMAVVFAVCLGRSTPGWFLRLGEAMPGWCSALPAAWPLAAATAGWSGAAAGVAASALMFAAACVMTARLLQRGTMRTGGVDPGRRGKRLWRRGERPLGIVGKDVALLLRDRTFLVQTVVVPVFVIGLQLVVNPGLGDAKDSGLAVLAYGIGAYSLLGGGFQVLSAEGRALWMLYTLPVPLAQMVRRKVMIWAATGTTFATAALLIFALRAGVTRPSLLLDLGFVAAGVWCAAYIAAGIGIVGCNPIADHVPRQPKARHVYLYFFCAACYGTGLAAALPVRAAALLVFATVAYAIWQRASDRLPWLLDPVDDAAPRIGVHDGALAVLVFFVLQAVTLLLLITFAKNPEVDSRTLLITFVVSGSVTVLLWITMLLLRGIDAARELGCRPDGAVKAIGGTLLGAALGLGLGFAGRGYVQWLRESELLALPPVPTVDLGLTLLAVVAAPLIEETLFRGLLLRGLERSVRPTIAVLWSAALFAVVHPLPAWIPVFVLGVVAALLRQRVGFLPAAMAAHAAYNFVVLGA